MSDTALQSTRIPADINSPHYENLNGAVNCFRHVGYSAQAVIKSNPSVRVFSTDLTRWVRLNRKVKFDFANLVGSQVICEGCRYGY